MKKMKTLYSCICLLAFLGTKSQNKIQGRILDDKDQPLPYCALALVSAKDSSQVKGNVTNDKGEYVFTGIPNGTYLIKAASAGFND
jgi:hypothetical protein